MSKTCWLRCHLLKNGSVALGWAELGSTGTCVANKDASLEYGEGVWHLVVQISECPGPIQLVEALPYIVSLLTFTWMDGVQDFQDPPS